METKVARPIVAMLSVTLSLYGLYGCATASKDLTPTYASPMQYQGYDCDQITAEIQRISARANQLGGRLDEAASNDKGITAVGIILFWPILFALGGTKQQEAEYSRLKGEYDALEQQAVLKKCTVVPRTTTATAVPGAAPDSPAPGQAGSVATPLAVTTAVSNPVPIVAVPSVPGAAMSPTSTSNIAAVAKTSTYMINAERHAKTLGCENPTATMNISSATYETFTILCAKGEPMSIRCDDGNTCRALQ